MRFAFSLCLLALSASVGGQTVERPSFAGHWVLVQPEHPTAETAVSVTIRETKVKNGATGLMVLDSVTIQRRFSGSEKAESHTIGVEGGVVPGIPEGASEPVPMGRTRTSSGWFGDRLVFFDGRYTGPTTKTGPFKEHEEWWTIDGQGRLVIETIERSSESPTKKTVAAYRRASAG